MDGWCAMGLTARERSLAKGERSQTIHLAGVRGSPPTCSMSLGSTHSTAMKGRSSTHSHRACVASNLHHKRHTC